MVASILAAAERVGLHPAMLGALFSLSIKVLGSVLALFVFAVAARSMSMEAFGYLAVTFNIVAFLAVIGVLGQDTLIIRNWAETQGNDDPAGSWGAYLFGWRVAAVSGLVTALAFALFCVVHAPFDETHLLPVPTTAGPIAAASAFLFAQVLLHYASHSARAISGVAVAEPNRELTWRIILVVVFVVVIAVDPEDAVTAFFASATLGAFIAAAVQTTLVLRGMAPEVRRARPVMQARAWGRRTIGMVSSAAGEAASQYAEVIIIGAVTSPAVSAAYFVVARLANVFPMIATGLHGYSSSRFANLYYAGRMREVQNLLAKVMLVALALVGALAFVVVVAGEPLLGLFGESYRSAYPTLLILSIGTAFAALMGPGGGIMLMTGYENVYSRVLIFSVLARAAALVLLAPAYGTVGAAVAVVAVSVPLSVGFWLFCRVKVGIDPSVIGIFLPPRDPVPAPGPAA
ncbi:lipopolysaccharide biosynthesis protein [Mongoliimonas terrestris]|uniref:lipopolysaccharide biosynthesis protein n=1 Tax=Mongoliimonas terrestris TaxID=1709001 RepID=UPI0009498B31|nr:polysaccharide biosynthesis C-terminal domain-containing protein [Mongoliimonas terrestris]